MNIDDLLNDPCTSFWLKNALNSALKRDAVDAVGDAKLLVWVLESRLNRAFEEYSDEMG